MTAGMIAINTLSIVDSVLWYEGVTRNVLAFTGFMRVPVGEAIVNGHYNVRRKYALFCVDTQLSNAIQAIINFYRTVNACRFPFLIIPGVLRYGVARTDPISIHSVFVTRARNRLSQNVLLRRCNVLNVRSFIRSIFDVARIINVVAHIVVGLYNDYVMVRNGWERLCFITMGRTSYVQYTCGFFSVLVRAITVRANCIRAMSANARINRSLMRIRDLVVRL